MSCVEGLLAQIAPEAQTEVQRRLSGLFGGMLRHYLPQTWVFVTEDGTASLHVDGRGFVAAHAGAMGPADVTVEVGHERLRAALTTRRRDSVGPGPLNVTAHTAKGKAAYGLLHERLGL